MVLNVESSVKLTKETLRVAYYVLDECEVCLYEIMPSRYNLECTLKRYVDDKIGACA